MICVTLIPMFTSFLDVGTVSAVKKEDIVQKSIFRKDEEGMNKCGLGVPILLFTNGWTSFSNSEH